MKDYMQLDNQDNKQKDKNKDKDKKPNENTNENENENENETSPLIQNEITIDNTHDDSKTFSKLLGEIESAQGNNDEDEIRQSKHMWGIGLVFLCACSYSCYSLIAKYLLTYRNVPYIQIVFARSVVTWLLNWAWIQWYRRRGEFFNYFGERAQRKWLIVRSVSCFLAVFLWNWSLLWLTPGDSDTIWQINAFWVLISAHFVLGEKMDLISWLCVSVGIVGVILVAQPAFIFHIHNQYSSELGKWIGIVMVLFSTLFDTVHVLVIRAKTVSIHWLQFEFFTSTCATWIFIPTIGLGYFLAHYFMHHNATKAVLTILTLR